MRTLAVDVVSDVVCPWCLIGVRRLELALEALPDVTAEVRFHPFLLDPSTPDEGEDLRERLSRKYGLPAERMFERVESAARDSGIPLDYSKITRSVSTGRAHTLLRHALERGTQRALKKALLEAYFLEGRDVSDLEVLVSIARAHGFGDDEARALLGDDAELRATRDVAASWAEQGINGVPFFIFGPQSDDAGTPRLAVSGAQPVDTMKAAIEQSLSPRRA